MLCSALYHCGLTCFVQALKNKPREGCDVATQTEVQHFLLEDDDDLKVVFIDQTTRTLPISTAQSRNVKESSSQWQYSKEIRENWEQKIVDQQMRPDQEYLKINKQEEMVKTKSYGEDENKEIGTVNRPFTGDLGLANHKPPFQLFNEKTYQRNSANERPSANQVFVDQIQQKKLRAATQNPPLMDRPCATDSVNQRWSNNYRYANQTLKHKPRAIDSANQRRPNSQRSADHMVKQKPRATDSANQRRSNSLKYGDQMLIHKPRFTDSANQRRPNSQRSADQMLMQKPCGTDSAVVRHYASHKEDVLKDRAGVTDLANGRRSASQKLAEDMLKEKLESVRTRKAISKLDRRRKARETWSVLRTRLVRYTKTTLSYIWKNAPNKYSTMTLISTAVEQCEEARGSCRFKGRNSQCLILLDKVATPR
jgi:hypothetical protein